MTKVPVTYEPLDTPLRHQIEELFIKYQKVWESQGRPPEAKWGVENFRTGQGQLFFDELATVLSQQQGE